MSKLNLPDFAIRHPLKINTFNLELFRIRDIDTLFEILLTKELSNIDVADERMPYWADVWPSAIGLAEFIATNSKLVNGKKCVELGCGSGLPGIVAAKCGGDLLMTDYLDEAIDFAKLNWKNNLTQEFHSKKIDWRTIDDQEKFSVIIASDVAYESRSFGPLIEAFKKLLKMDGVILLSEPNRKFASPFVKMLSKEFVVEKIDTTVKLDDLEYTISIYQCKLR